MFWWYGISNGMNIAIWIFKLPIKNISKNTDLYFYIDKKQYWYHKGIDGITNNIDDTVLYLNSILFGSLCNVSSVIAFIPRTKLINPINKKYGDLKLIVNNQTNYILYGDTKIKNENDNHHISQCNNLNCFQNVKIIYNKGLNMRVLRDNGTIKKIIDNILINYL